jgi:hypothetical protein
MTMLGATGRNSALADMFQPAEIPRAYYNSRPAGPYVIPPGVKFTEGDHKCSQCGRNVAPRKGSPNKGSCRCVYYKRCTTFIDVLQSEFALKQWDRRMVAYGMSQRPDLVLAAAASDPNSPSEKRGIQSIAGAAIEHARGSAAANIGTALHKLTERMDRGEKLGVVPEPFPADLRAYEECVKAEKLEWVGVESFRVHDEYQVAGTTDRIGWYRGRLRIFDLKTSPNENPISYPHGPSMQLAMYAHSVPYIYPGDYRTADVADVDTDVAYIINMPAGSGRCELRPVNIAKGWGACTLAVQVWRWRDTKGLIMDPDKVRDNTTFKDMAVRAGTVTELKMLWRNAKDSGALTDDLKIVLKQQAEKLRGTA